jgi:SAM-dependent methyltransferase
LRKLTRDWDELAQLDPLWAIASDPRKQYGKWSVEDFFAGGRARVERWFQMAAASGIRIGEGTCLDFGCGVGRLTQALAARFDSCCGVDISPEMIMLARRYNRFGERCQYLLNQDQNLGMFGDGVFDCVLTTEVLQHMPPHFALTYLEEFLRLLKPQGVLLFEVPTQMLVQDTRALYLKTLPKFHWDRIRNKLRGIVTGHDATTWYYRLRVFRGARKLLYHTFGLRPAIHMYCLEEECIREVMDKGRAEVTILEEREWEGRTHSLFLARKRLTPGIRCQGRPVPRAAEIAW